MLTHFWHCTSIYTHASINHLSKEAFGRFEALTEYSEVQNKSEVGVIGSFNIMSLLCQEQKYLIRQHFERFFCHLRARKVTERGTGIFRQWLHISLGKKLFLFTERANHRITSNTISCRWEYYLWTRGQWKTKRTCHIMRWRNCN